MLKQYPAASFIDFMSNLIMNELANGKSFTDPKSAQ
jgi:hypothetical protein